MNTEIVEQRSEEIARLLRREVRRAPYRTLGLALATGYVLGGGLSPRAVGFVVSNVGRVMAGSLVFAVIRGLLEERRTTCP
jgi:hypothetical protein